MWETNGVPASPGIVIGKVLKLQRELPAPDAARIRPEQAGAEEQKYHKAIRRVRGNLEKLIARGAGTVEEDIFQTHLSILEDPYLEKLVFEAIRRSNRNVQQALTHAVEQISERFHAMEDEYLKERVADLRDVYEQVFCALQGIAVVRLSRLESEVVVLAKNLAPSDTAVMDLDKVLGFATELGGKTSHTAIMARNVDIPAVVGCRGLLDNAGNGDTVILDGQNGRVILNPTEAVLEEYRRQRRRLRRKKEKLHELRGLPPVTPDGKQLELWANVDSARDIPAVLKSGAGGIGLLRTEFLYMVKKCAPTEEEQFAVYSHIARQMEGKPVVVRTLDIGGDKEIRYFPRYRQDNPSLGYRSVRFALDNPPIFKSQLRALLRAGTQGEVRVMFPMIASVEELRACRGLLEECKGELEREGVPYSRHISAGAMVETPSAVWLLDRLAPYADFFSIGTNDLTQFMLAVDRGNERVQYLYNSLHPAMLAGIRQVIQSAARLGKPVCVCGEIAGEPRAAVLLAGMGVNTLSASTSLVPAVKQILRETPYLHAQAVARGALALATAAEVEAYLEAAVPLP